MPIKDRSTPDEVCKLGASPVAVNISIMIFRILLNHAAMGHGCLCSAYDKGLDH